MSERFPSADPDGRQTATAAILRLIAENPISAFNAAAILVGGGIVYQSNQSRMDTMDSRIAIVERQVIATETRMGISDEKANQENKVITRELGDVKVTVRGIESSVQFLVNQSRRERAQ